MCLSKGMDGAQASSRPSSRPDGKVAGQANFDRLATRMLGQPVGAENVAILSTIGEDGRPHAAWMGSVASADLSMLYTLTSPDSAKAANIRRDPRVEWMLVDAARETVLYADGQARLIEEVGEMKRIWQMFPDKSRSYFLGFFNSAPGYAVIETAIESLRLIRPKEGLDVMVDPARLADVSP